MAGSKHKYTEALLNDLEHNEDGTFKLENKAGQAYLRVYPPGRDGKAADAQEIWARIELFGITGASRDAVKKIIEEADADDHEIGKWQVPDSQDATCQVDITPDRMRAYVTLTPPRFHGKAISIEDMQAALKQENVKFGTNQSVLESLAKDPVYHERQLVAEGKPAVQGANGSIRLKFETNVQPRPKPDAKGRVDFRELGVIKSVKAGKVVAEKISARQGEYGQNLLGEMLPYEEVSDAEWHLGANVELDETGLRLKAKITGRPMTDRSGAVRIDEVVQLENVDYSTGHVDFPGTIIVQKCVADGFRLQTSGSIVIKKTVGKVFLKAGGDVELAQGFAGRGDGLIEADGNVHARFVEQGRIHADGTITILDSAMHSELVAGDSIFIKGGKGEFTGGEAITAGSFFCTRLGAKVETKTRVMIGTPPDLVEQLESMKDEIKAHHDVLEKVNQSLARLTEIEEDRKLTTEEKKMSAKLRRAHEKYAGLIETTTHQVELAVSSYKANPEAYLNASREILGGVEIALGMGKYFRVNHEAITGPLYLSLDEEGTVVQASEPPA